MKKTLLFFLAFVSAYFLIHSLSDLSLSFAEAYTSLLITGLTFLTFVALKMKRA